MTLQNRRQLAVTQKKLRMLEDRYASLKLEPAENPHVRELTLHSLKRLINELKEEITRFEAHLSPHARKS
jgi:hypothetical protein